MHAVYYALEFIIIIIIFIIFLQHGQKFFPLHDAYPFFMYVH